MLSNILDRVSYHAVYDETILSALEYAGKNGFTGVQVAVEAPHLSFESLSNDQCAEIKEFLSANNLRLVLHAPDDSVSLFQASRHLLDGIFAYYGALFSFAEAAGAMMVTFHLGSAPSFITDDATSHVLPKADCKTLERAVNENLSRLIDLAAGRFVLSAENYRLEGIGRDALAPHLENGSLALCWDIAKTFNRNGELNRDLEAYFLKNLQSVRQVHLHDLIPNSRSHRVIGSGVIDFQRFLCPLSSAGVLDYCIEVRPREKAEESLKSLRVIVNRL
jgi:sugar phosphate isomerase/epimerase